MENSDYWWPQNEFKWNEQIQGSAKSDWTWWYAKRLFFVFLPFFFFKLLTKNHIYLTLIEAQLKTKQASHIILNIGNCPLNKHSESQCLIFLGSHSSFSRQYFWNSNLLPMVPSTILNLHIYSRSSNLNVNAIPANLCLCLFVFSDINECEREPCKNGGLCTDLVANYSCECPGEYMGRNCQHSMYMLLFFILKCFLFFFFFKSNHFHTTHLILPLIAAVTT